MPGPYGVAWTGGGREGRGRAAALPLFPLTGCRGRLRAAYMPPLQSSQYRQRGFGGTPEFIIGGRPTGVKREQ